MISDSLTSLNLPSSFCKHIFQRVNFIQKFSSMETQSKLCIIENPPSDPMQFFLQLVTQITDSFLPMNIATVDSEYGVLNRTVEYRGVTDWHVTFITERNSRKYANIKENSKISVTFLLGNLQLENESGFWQVRIFGEAVELNAEQLIKCWESEPIFAKIRSRICECGKPVDHAELMKAHADLLKAYQDGKDKLPQTETYTGFKIIPTVWDFYKSKPSSIADRVMYKKQGKNADSWHYYHVAA